MHGLIPAGARGGTGVPPTPGPLARAIDAVGDRWTLLIVYQVLFGGMTRFGDFHRELRIPTNVLTRRLQALVQAGVLERVRAPRGHSLHEYRATPQGTHLWTVLAALHAWGATWSAADEEPQIGLAHGACGADLAPGSCCPLCAAEIAPGDLTPAFLDSTLMSPR